VAGEQGGLGGVELEANALQGETGKQKAVGTGRKEIVRCGIAFKSIGYTSVQMPGVPFDRNVGTVPHRQGRVVGSDGAAIPGLYACGWAKRGPTGVLVTNRMDAEETLESLLADLRQSPAGPNSGWEGIRPILDARDVPYVSFRDWKKLDQVELQRGKPVGKPREKLVSVDEMLRIIYDRPLDK